MKKLKKILLINWLYFAKELIEVEDINFLTGKNGAGKSTVIDALQIVLLGETNARNFNRQPMRSLSGHWTDTCGLIWTKITPIPGAGRITPPLLPANFWMMWRVSNLSAASFSTVGATEAGKTAFSCMMGLCRRTALYDRERPLIFLLFAYF